MDAYPYEWVCVSPGGNAGKTSCHTWNTQMASPLHTQNIKLLAYYAYWTAEEKKVWGEKILNMKSGKTNRSIAYSSHSDSGINICKYNWSQIKFSSGYFFGNDWLWIIRMKVDLPTAYLLNNKKTKIVVWKDAELLWLNNEQSSDVHAVGFIGQNTHNIKNL